MPKVKANQQVIENEDDDSSFDSESEVSSVWNDDEEINLEFGVSKQAFDVDFTEIDEDKLGEPKPKVRPKYPPLTPEEKAEILKRHEQLIDKLNVLLPPGAKIPFDLNLSKRLDDEDEIAAYRIAQEIQRKKEVQDHDYQQIIQENPDLAVDNGFKIARLFDSDEVHNHKWVNEKISSRYYKVPEKFEYSMIKRILDYDPQILRDVGTNKADVAEYYRDHFELCEFAAALPEYLEKNKDNLTEDVKNQLNGIIGMAKIVGAPVKMFEIGDQKDYFAMPNLTKEQAELLKEAMEEASSENRITSLASETKEILDAINAAAEGNLPKFTSPAEYLEKLGFEPSLDRPDINQHLMVRAMFVKDEAEADNFGDGLVPSGIPNNANKPQHQYVDISPDQVITLNEGAPGNKTGAGFGGKNLVTAKMLLLKKSMLGDYRKRWQKAFATKRGVGEKFDLKEIEETHQGNWMERKVLRSTSQQYKDMLQALKDFNDPESKHYLDYDHLKGKAQGYLDHKKEQGYGIDGKKMDHTSTIRSNLANTILAMETEQKKIVDEITKDSDELTKLDFKTIDKNLQLSKAEIIRRKEFFEEVKHLEPGHEFEFFIQDNPNAINAGEVQAYEEGYEQAITDEQAQALFYGKKDNDKSYVDDWDPENEYSELKNPENVEGAIDEEEDVKEP